MIYSTFALLSVAGASLGVGAVAIGLTWLLLRKRAVAISSVDRAVIAWLLYDAVTHLILVCHL